MSQYKGMEAVMNKQLNDQQASQTRCQATGDHYYALQNVPNSKHNVWLRICMSCGQIDNKDIDEQIDTLILSSQTKAVITEIDKAWEERMKDSESKFYDQWLNNGEVDIMTYLLHRKEELSSSLGGDNGKIIYQNSNLKFVEVGKDKAKITITKNVYKKEPNWDDTPLHRAIEKGIQERRKRGEKFTPPTLKTEDTNV